MIGSLPISLAQINYIKYISVVNYIPKHRIIAKEFALFPFKIEIDTQQATLAFGSLRFKKIDIQF